MLKNRVVYQAWPCRSTSMLIKEYGGVVSDDPYEPFDLMWFTGGADICPFLYGELPHSTYHGYLGRDRKEIAALKQARFGTPCIGVCRGAQLLNVMAGGSLYQDVNNHHGDHDAHVMSNGAVVNVNSIHHQMLIPAQHSKILMKAGVATRKEKHNSVVYVKPAGVEEGNDIEATWIPNHNYLCFQPHPEYASAKSDTRRTFEAFVKEYILPILNHKE